MNPPTLGHEKLLICLGNLAIERQADHIVFLSQSFDISGDPLGWEEKVSVFEEVFPGVNLSHDMDIKNPYQAIEYLAERYDRVTAVTGDDRIDGFRHSFERYQERWGIKFEAVSAGPRGGYSADEQASGTLVRELAKSGQYNEFAKYMPTRMEPQLSRYLFRLLNKRIQY